VKPWVGSGCWVLLLVGSVGAACSTTNEPPGENVGGEAAGGASAAAAGETASAGESVSAGESGAGAVEPGEPLALEDAWLPMLEAFCEQEERCHGTMQYRHVPGGCVAALSRSWQEAFAELALLIEKGTAKYDAQLAPACVEARRNERCDATRFPPECEAAIDGLLEPGDACDEGVECAGSASCAGCPRQCVQYPAGGEACDDRCDVGLRCTEGRCVAQLLEGDSCGLLEEGLSCGPSLYCARDVEGEPGICRLNHAAKLGEPCGEPGVWWCEGDAACVVTQIVGEARQWECVAPSESGGECWSGEGDTCPPGEYCPTPAEGEVSARCMPLARQGERCPEYRECEHGTSCLFGNTCVKLGELGDACVVDADCYYGLCAEGECVSTRSCDVPIDETQLLHSPPRPKEACPSEAPGALLEGWDSAEAALGWVEGLDEAAGTAAWLETERFSCSGALHLHATLSESAPEAFLIRDTVDSAEPDWSGYRRVHSWVRLAEPGVGNVEGLVNVVTSVLVPNGEQSFSVHQKRLDASWLRDWQWHELVLELPLDGRESVTTFRVSLELQAPDGVVEPIELDLYVDDIWLE
jgi:hypothetical protein